MKRYPEYRISEIEWMGEIPMHWNLKRIKHTTYVKGRIGWQGLRSDEFLEKGDSYVVTGTDFNCGKVNWETCYQITKSRYDEDPFIQLKENDLLITKDGTIGKIALVKNIPGIATLNSGIFVTRPKTNDYITEFMYWVLQSDVFTSFINHNKSGSTILHLYQNVFNEFSFPCPLIEEQTQIAKYLDHKTAQIDKLISDKEKLIELLNEERTAIINQAVTKGLNPDVPVKDSGIEWLGEVPEHWEVKKLKYIAKVVLGKMLTNDDKGGYFRKAYLRAKNVGWVNVINVDDIKEMWFSKSELTQYRINLNDLLISEGGEVGRTCIWKEELEECYIQNSVHKVTTNDNYNPLFLLYLFNFFGFKGHFDAIVNKISIAHLTKEKLSDIKVIVPPEAEQDKLVSFILNELNRIDELQSKIQQEIHLLKEYKTALISEVVTGKVDIRDELLKPEALA